MDWHTFVCHSDLVFEGNTCLFFSRSNFVIYWRTINALF